MCAMAPRRNICTQSLSKSTPRNRDTAALRSRVCASRIAVISDVMFGHLYEGNRFTATGSLKALTRLAYGLRQYPSSLRGTDLGGTLTLYDIHATTAEGDPTPPTPCD